LSRQAPRPHIMAMPLRVPIRLPTYTTDDLRRFPRDGQRYELLDGFLLVTPAPGTAHQGVLSRLMAALLGYLPEGAPGRVTSPGEIEIAPKILLDPDVLVWPSSYKLGTPWTAISGWWLAVEVSGRTSRVYDRDFKRDAYLALGVREVWLVDLHDRRVLVSGQGTQKDVPHSDELLWHPPQMPAPLSLDLRALFAGLG
jgi:Uma2 family endonuclease